ncbi:glycoside hydrolase family 32 protein [Paenibacillus mendelii]|uniref:Sucrose-6-phosphate hydrolase n=1 Tax=Paenibacillus mendelii TaxID=206163 RepID=A0ABV6JAK6_9BACL|nr:glycoside hydrolase family 32 protein [Paenibacillus mendelii]MCQ6563800.1 glycoside hydrolase family 32 protein [Paenibacillus mendelii]
MNEHDRQHQILIQQATASAAQAHESVSKDYYRQGFHIMPQAYFMNDPNGLVYYKGEYHAFFQHLPFSVHDGEKVWGHVKSKDLVHWEYLPVAIAPSQSYDRNGCYSGSAVDDNGILTLIYTGYIEREGDRTAIQMQNLAFSEDGIVFHKYENNPVISDPPEDGSLADFRDPKVWRHEDTWYMVVGSSKFGYGKTLMYRSENLRQWDYIGVAAESDGSMGQVWECPDMFPFERDTHVFLTSSLIIENEAITGGKNLYMVGSLNYEQGKFNSTFVGETDCGLDFYAAQTFHDGLGRRILIGWMDWHAAPRIEAVSNWFGSLTVPRIMTLLPDGSVQFTPAPELQQLREGHQHFEEVNLQEGIRGAWGDIVGDCLEIIAEFELGDAEPDAEFSISLRRSELHDQETIITYSSETETLTFNRDKSGSGFTGSKSCSLLPMSGGRIKLHIIMDRSSVEIFMNEGRLVSSNRIYPHPNSQGLDVYASKGTVKLKQLDVWKLKRVTL